MDDQLTYRPSRTDVDVAAAVRFCSHGFGTPAPDCEAWLRRAGVEHLRLLEHQGRPVACLLRVPMGTYFGGARLPSMGVAGVAVAPEERGRGHARALMRALLREAADEGMLLSSLYASTQALYRSVGYEQAGHHGSVRLPLAVLPASPDLDLTVEPLTEITNEVRDVYTRFARGVNGALDRGPYLWGRILDYRGARHDGFGVRGPDGALEGYVFLHQKLREGEGTELHVSDLVFVTARAARRLLAFLRSFGTVAHAAVLKCGPTHPVLLHLEQQRFELVHKEFWMMRVLNIGQALTRRGYPSSTSGRAFLQIEDAQFPQQSGPYMLEVVQGVAHVERQADGPVLTLGPRGLAALFTGYLSARDLVLAGLAEGSDAAVEAASNLFVARAPWAPDFY